MVLTATAGAEVQSPPRSSQSVCPGCQAAPSQALWNRLFPGRQIKVTADHGVCL